MDSKFMLTPNSVINTMAVTEVLHCNEVTARYGLWLTQTEAKELVETQAKALRSHGRVSLEGGVIIKMIKAFCDSAFIIQSNYAEILSDLVDTFYYFKNETLDELSDDELIALMRDFFNHTGYGSMELLQNRELEALARCIRYGYGPDGGR